MSTERIIGGRFVKHIDLDLDGLTIKEALGVLEGLLKKHGKNAVLDDDADWGSAADWTIVERRDETDRELAVRRVLAKEREMVEREAYRTLHKKYGKDGKS